MGGSGLAFNLKRAVVAVAVLALLALSPSLTLLALALAALLFFLAHLPYAPPRWGSACHAPSPATVL